MQILRSIAVALATAVAHAQAWPARPVTIVAGSQAGSGIDSIARFVAEGLRERTGQEPLPGSPESLLKSIVDERAKWEPIVRKAGIEPE